MCVYIIMIIIWCRRPGGRPCQRGGCWGPVKFMITIIIHYPTYDDNVSFQGLLKFAPT